MKAKDGKCHTILSSPDDSAIIQIETQQESVLK